jgi:nicotinamidase-related amidase
MPDEPRPFNRPALIIWNMQKGVVYRAKRMNELIPHIKDLSESARKYNVPIIYGQHANVPYKWMDPETRKMLTKMGVEPRNAWMQLGSPEWEIVQDLKPDPSDLVLPVHTSSFFKGTMLDEFLHMDNIRTLILTGFASHSGILITARESVMNGYHVVVVEDGVGGISLEDHEDSLRLLREGCEVITCQEVMNRFELRAERDDVPLPLIAWKKPEDDDWEDKVDE